MSARLGLAGRAAATLLDQAICSLGNFVVVLAGLHLLSLSGFGSLTLPYTCATLGVIGVRLLVVQDLTISFATARVDERRQAARAASGAAAVLGLVLGALVAAVSPLMDSDSAATWLTTAAILPLLFVQDAWRLYFLSAGRPDRAVTNDGICLLGTVTALGAIHFTGGASPAMLMGAWGVGAGAGMLAGIAQTGLIPRVDQSVAWIRRQREIGLPLAGGVLIAQGATRLCFLILALVSGSAALGLLSTASAAVAPVNIFLVGTSSFALPEFARRVGDPSWLWRFAVRMSIGLAVVCAVFSGLLLVLPDWAAQSYIGAHWAASRRLLLPVTLWTAGTALAVGPSLLLCVSGSMGRMVRLYLRYGIVMVGLTSAGCIAWDSAGAAWGLAVGSLVGAGMWWRAVTRRPRAGAAGAGPGAIPAPRKSNEAADLLT